MMMPRISKNCRKLRARNPVERVTPSGVPFFITYTSHSLRIFSGFYLTNHETIRKLCSI
nr:MAG TPA: hypothetical protein [Bacteriophage sp.]